MSIFDNPAFYVSIFSSICFIASEMLPFIPTQGNGIIHAIALCLSSYNKPAEKTPNNTDLDQIINRLDTINTKLESNMKLSRIV